MIERIVSKWLAADELSRALQLSGFIRFGFLLLQGIILVKAGLDPFVIAIVESFYFLFNLSRSALLSGGKYAGFSGLKDKSISFTDYFTSFTFFGAIAAFVVFMLSWFGGETFSSFLSIEAVPWLLPVVVLFSMPADAYDVFYIKRKKYRSIYLYTLAVCFLQMAGLVLLLLLGYTMAHVLWYMLVLFVLRYFHLGWNAFRGRKLDVKLVYVFVLGAIPLVFHSLLAGLSSYVDGWIIKHFFDDSIFAIYRYGARELPLNTILIGSVVSGLIMATTPIEEKIKIEMKRVLRLLVPVLSVLILISPLLFQWVYDEEYKLSALFFNLYAVLILSRIFFVQVFFYRAGHRWSLTLLSAVEVVLNIVLSLILLRAVGLVGIPLATILADVVVRAAMVIWSNQRYSKTLASYVPMRTYLISSTILLLAFASSVYIFFKDDLMTLL